MKIQFVLINIVVIAFFLFNKYNFQQINSEFVNKYKTNDDNIKNYDNQFEFEIIDYPRPINSNTNQNKQVENSPYAYSNYDQKSFDYNQVKPYDYNYNIFNSKDRDIDNIISSRNNDLKEDENIDNQITINSLNQNNDIINRIEDQNDYYIELDNASEQNNPYENKNLIDYLYNLNEPQGLLKELKDELDVLFYRKKNQLKNTNDSRENETLIANFTTTKTLLTTLFQNLASSKNSTALLLNNTLTNSKNSNNTINNNNDKEYSLVSTYVNTSTSKSLQTQETFTKILTNHLKQSSNTSSTQVLLNQNSTSLDKKLEDLDNVSKSFQKLEDFYDIDLESSRSDSPLLAKTNTFHFVEKRKNSGKKEDQNEKEKSNIDPSSSKFMDYIQIPTPTIYFILFFASVIIIINFVFFKVFLCHKKSD